MNYKTRQPFPNAAYVEGQRNFTYFDRSLTSGLTDVVIESPGDFLYIDQASTGVVSVELNMRQGGTLAPILLAAGGSIECDFASFKINATAQLGKTVRVIVGNGARIKGGANVNASSMSVSVVDGGKLRTIANQAFMGYQWCAAAAATYAHCQLWNAAGTGKNVIVERVWITSGSNIVTKVGAYNIQLSSAGGYSPASKLAGGAAGQAVFRKENNAAMLTSGDYYVQAVSANAVMELQFTEPVLLAPGAGLVALSNVLNTDISATWEYYEE